MSDVRRFTRNAARDILVMTRARQAVVRDGKQVVPVKNFRHARQIKAGKLFRCLGILRQALYDGSDRADTVRRIRTFQRVVVNVQKMSRADAERLAGW